LVIQIPTEHIKYVELVLKNLHLPFSENVFFVWLLKILHHYYKKCKFFSIKPLADKGLRPLRVNQRCYPYIKIRRNRSKPSSNPVKKPVKNQIKNQGRILHEFKNKFLIGLKHLKKTFNT